MKKIGLLGLIFSLPLWGGLALYWFGTENVSRAGEWCIYIGFAVIVVGWAAYGLTVLRKRRAGKKARATVAPAQKKKVEPQLPKREEKNAAMYVPHAPAKKKLSRNRKRAIRRKKRKNKEKSKFGKVMGNILRLFFGLLTIAPIALAIIGMGQSDEDGFLFWWCIFMGIMLFFILLALVISVISDHKSEKELQRLKAGFKVVGELGIVESCVLHSVEAKGKLRYRVTVRVDGKIYWADTYTEYREGDEVEVLTSGEIAHILGTEHAA